MRRILLNSYRSAFRKLRVAEDLIPSFPDRASVGGFANAESADPAGWHDDRSLVLAAVGAPAAEPT